MTFDWTLPLRELTSGILHLFFPRLCVACEQELPLLQSCFCLSCQLQVEPTFHHFSKENEFTERFWGRLNLQTGAAMYYFRRKTPVQHALHGLKYGNRPDVGLRLGRTFGELLRQSDVFAGIDLIVPVPLHPKKERSRGYNQSALFAQGLGESLDRSVQQRALARQQFTASQTRKKRMERFGNTDGAFRINKPRLLQDKHTLLVDDVLTTGATLEACGNLILQIPGARISCATIAIAQH